MLCIAATVDVIARSENAECTLVINQGSAAEVDCDDCTLLLKANDFGSGTEISIEIKNKPGNYYLLLFDRAYTVKELKKMKPSIRFDKVYSSANRNIIPCDALSDLGTMMIEPDKNESITFRGFTGDRIKCELPICVATHKKKRFLSKEKYLICESETKTLFINIQRKEQPVADTDYERIKEECEDLIDELKDKTFCGNKKHRPSFKEQTEFYEGKKQALKDQIEGIKSSNGWGERSKEYQKYKALIAQLDAIEYQKQDCGGHTGRVTDPQLPHKCKYCTWTAKEAYDYMDRAFNGIYNSIDPQKEKRKRKAEVEALHKAYTSTCPNLKRAMQAEPQAKKNADDYYKDIIDY